MKWRIDEEGYIARTVYNPITKRKVPVRQHRLVWEAYHGPIPHRHVIHHKNGIKTDNRIENLECLLSRSAHTSLHMRKAKALGVVSNCPYCAREFVKFNDKKYCSQRCRTGAAVKRWRQRNPEEHRRRNRRIRKVAA
jgi:hypothetical protein